MPYRTTERRNCELCASITQCIQSICKYFYIDFCEKAKYGTLDVVQHISTRNSFQMRIAFFLPPSLAFILFCALFMFVRSFIVQLLLLSKRSECVRVYMCVHNINYYYYCSLLSKDRWTLQIFVPIFSDVVVVWRSHMARI